MSDGPSFIHLDKLRDLQKTVFRLWRAQDYEDENGRVIIPKRDIEEFFTAALLVPNNKVLLLGDPSTGKTLLVQLIAKALNAKFAKIVGAPEKTMQKVIARTKIAKLIKEGVEEFEIRDFVLANVKFINEINRFSLEVQDALLSLLWEREVELAGGKIVRSPEYIAFADMNPYRGDIDRALKSRFYFSVWIPHPGIMESMEIELLREELGVDEFVEALREPIMNWSELVEAWKDVKKVSVDAGAIFLAKMIMYSMSGCVLQDWEPDYKRPCGDCPYNEGACKYVARPIEQRALKAAVQLAKARAWLNKRARVEANDIVWALTFSIPHRLEFTPMAKATIPLRMVWVRQTIDEIIRTKYIKIVDGKVERGVWWKAIVLWNAIMAGPEKLAEQLKEIGLDGKISKGKLISEFKKLDEDAKDLVIHKLYTKAYRIHTALTEQEDRRLEEMIKELVKEGSREALQKASALAEEIVNDTIKNRVLNLLAKTWSLIEIEVEIDEAKLAKLLAKIGVSVKEATDFVKQYRSRIENNGWILVKEGDRLKIQAPSIAAMEELQLFLEELSK